MISGDPPTERYRIAVGPGANPAATTAATDQILDAIAGLVPELARALGPGIEVVLHDLAKLPNSIVAIGNPITGRSVGDPPTDLLLQDLRQGRTDGRYRYRARTASGRTMRSSTIFVRNSTGVPVATLCMNEDITGLLQARALIESELGPDDASLDVTLPSPQGHTTDPGPEAFPHGVEELSGLMLRRAVSTIAVPPELMLKRHKLAVVRELEGLGFFLIRDAIELAARALGVTRYTIYNYLNEIAADQDLREQ